MTTYADNAPGEELLFKFGDGLTPTETFTHACSVNSDRSLDFISEIYQSTVPACDDPSAPAKTIRRVKSKDIKFSGAGVADMASFKTLLQLWNTGTPFNGKAIQDVDAHGWTITALWVIESMKVGGMRGEDQEFSISVGIADEATITYA